MDSFKIGLQLTARVSIDAQTRPDATVPEGLIVEPLRTTCLIERNKVESLILLA